jgi:fatty acid desaturase
MATDQLTTSSLSLNSPELLRRVKELRQTDNRRGWLYLAREYLFLTAVVGAAITFVHLLEFYGWSWVWAIPVTLLTVILVGAGQHRLVTLTHEAAHYMLFRHRLLNELISEWFCMYPVLGTTHKYRVQHLGHHQFPNDPQRDTDFLQLGASGHIFRFPMPRARFVWECIVKQILWLPNTIRYALVRATFDGTNKCGPYRRLGDRSPLLPAVSAVYLLGLIGGLSAFGWAESSLWLGLFPVLMLAVALAFFFLVSARHFTQYAIKSDLSPRFQACLRVTYYTLLTTALAWLTYLTGRPWWLYYFAFWMVPLGTTFSFFMILRQLVQHGNADTERFTNTRVFKVAWPIGAAVFPIGNDYHLPHHLFPMVPHYNLRKLHKLLMQTDEYRHQAVVVEGYFLPPTNPPEHPTVVDVMTATNYSCSRSGRKRHRRNTSELKVLSRHVGDG